MSYRWSQRRCPSKEKFKVHEMHEIPTASQLLAAASLESSSLADEVDVGVRKRLLVLAHTTQLAARELAAAETPVADESGAARQFTVAIRAGDHDHELSAVLARVRSEVRARVDVSTPGYADDR